MKDLVLIRNGFPFDSSRFSPEGAYPVVRIRDLNARDAATRYEGPTPAGAWISRDDVLVGMDGEFAVGRWRGDEAALLNQRMAALSSPDATLLRYVEFSIVHELVTINTLAFSTTVKHLSSSEIGDIRIPLPATSSELRQLVAFLDYETAHIDALVHEQEALGRLLAERRTAVVAAAVFDAPGGQGSSRLTDGWTRSKLGYRYSVELGKMLDAKQNIGGNQYPYLRNQDVQWVHINTTDLPTIKLEPDEVSRYTVSDGDILVCEGGDVGRAAIWRGTSGGVAYQKALHRLRPLNPQEDVPEYLVYLLMAAKSHGVFDRDDKRSTIAHLPAEAFRQYRFSFPPLEAQQRIVSRLDVETQRIDALAVEADRVAATLRERRSALITAAVTGQIDVSAWTPPDDWLSQEAA